MERTVDAAWMSLCQTKSPRHEMPTRKKAQQCIDFYESSKEYENRK